MLYRIYQTPSEVLIEDASSPGVARRVCDFSFDELFSADDAGAYAGGRHAAGSGEVALQDQGRFLVPIGSQEVWAAGVTYLRSRSARMEESDEAGGAVFYDKVYEADRPELFFKATASRVRGHGDPVGIRMDSYWDVPEPELTLAVSNCGRIFGFTIGNDMSSRSIEGENPLYLPQAKVYTGSAALGPCLVVGEVVTPETVIDIVISRRESQVFSGRTRTSRIKRELGELVEFLFRSNEFEQGVYLMTGTGVVPDTSFTLEPGDQIDISISGIGTLTNHVVRV